MILNKVKAARKSPGKCGKCGTEIAVGSPYRWWKFRFGGKRIRCMGPNCSPRPSEMISSPFLSTAAALEETLQDAVDAFESDLDVDALQGAVEEAAQGFRDLGEEAQGSFDNMPEGLQQGDTGQMLEERVSKCDEIADELDGLDLRSTWDDIASELPEVDVADDWTDEALDRLATTLEEETKAEDETRQDYVERLGDAVEDKRQEAREAVVEEVNGVSLEVE